MELSDNAMRIFKDLYCYSDETVEDAFTRVSKEFGNEENSKKAMQLLKENKWRPSTPIWFNSGSNKKIFAACWVTDIEDSMDSIYDVANVARKIFQSGAGIGIPIGNLREKNANIYEGKDLSENPSGKSSGPVSFMHLYDAVGATTKSGGRARRAAIMCVMPVDHPDIIDFISCKSVDGVLSNMNISVALTDKFMQAFKDNIPFELKSIKTGLTVKEINARELWDKIVDMAWKTADPGILFIDTINKFNPLRSIKKVSCTNPCLTGDTLIDVFEFGKIPIKELKDGHVILSYDIENNKIDYDMIEWVGKTKKNANIIELEIEENNKKYYLKCTPDHLIFTRNRGYIEAKDLNKNDDIIINIS